MGKKIMISERQKKIFNIVVQEYIKSAQPVSSKFLEKKHNLGICPASIRIEMQKLTSAGLICQPHTSSGRIPTDKGYRFFVDGFLACPEQENEKKEDFLEKKVDFETNDWFERKLTNSIKILQSVIKNLALISSNLALGYLSSEEIFWQDGWEKVIKEPEFVDKKNIDNFIKTIDFFEDEITGLKESLKRNSSIKVYIGKENPFYKTKEFSIIIGGCCFPKKEEGVLAILGPKRMDYSKNISLMNSLIEALTELEDL